LLFPNCHRVEIDSLGRRQYQQFSNFKRSITTNTSFFHLSLYYFDLWAIRVCLECNHLWVGCLFSGRVSLTLGFLERFNWLARISIINSLPLQSAGNAQIVVQRSIRKTVAFGSEQSRDRFRNTGLCRWAAIHAATLHDQGLAGRCYAVLDVGGSG